MWIVGHTTSGGQWEQPSSSMTRSQPRYYPILIYRPRKDGRLSWPSGERMEIWWYEIYGESNPGSSHGFPTMLQPPGKINMKTKINTKRSTQNLIKHLRWRFSGKQSTVFSCQLVSPKASSSMLNLVLNTRVIPLILFKSVIILLMSLSCSSF